MCVLMAFWKAGGHVCTCCFCFRLPPVSCVMIFLYEFWVNLEIPVTELAQVIAALGLILVSLAKNLF